MPKETGTLKICLQFLQYLHLQYLHFVITASIKFNLGKCASFISMCFKSKCDLTLEMNVYPQNDLQ